MKCQRRVCGVEREGSSRGPPLPADEHTVPRSYVVGTHSWLPALALISFRQPLGLARIPITEREK